MKKTYVEMCGEKFVLCTGIDALGGSWILETNGGPTCLNEMEDLEAFDDIREIEEIISDPSTPWEELTEEDEEYISDTLHAWGC